MDASTEGLVAACGHHKTTIQMDAEAEGLAEELELCVLFAMDASKDGLVVAHGHCCYVICTRLAVVAAVKLLMNSVIYVYVMPQELILGVTFC